jgi:hypothetical protein
MISQEELKDELVFNKTIGQFYRISTDFKETGSKRGDGYISVSCKGRLYYAHKLAWLYCYGEYPLSDVDHINGNRADNRISNLRLATRSQNVLNSDMKSNNKSGYKGVSWDKAKRRWRVCCSVSGKNVHVGYFRDLVKASQAYNEFAKKNHGEFYRYVEPRRKAA